MISFNSGFNSNVPAGIPDLFIRWSPRNEATAYFYSLRSRWEEVKNVSEQRGVLKNLHHLQYDAFVFNRVISVEQELTFASGLGPVHTTPEDFENGGFTLKTHFRPHYAGEI